MYRVLANTPMPDSEDGFLEDTKQFYPNLYDVKYMKEDFDDLKGGLARLGDMLNLNRHGISHQAGSDSWLTGLTYFKLIEDFLKGVDIAKEFNNAVSGFGKAKTDEYYLDQYTSKTEQLEREAREYQHLDEHYTNNGQYQQYPYYSMSPNPMEYPNENMMQSYAYSSPMLQPHQQVPQMHPGYISSPNHVEYADNNVVYNEQMNMAYPMQNPYMQGGRPDQNNMEGYNNENYF